MCWILKYKLVLRCDKISISNSLIIVFYYSTLYKIPKMIFKRICILNKQRQFIVFLIINFSINVNVYHFNPLIIKSNKKIISLLITVSIFHKSYHNREFGNEYLMKKILWIIIKVMRKKKSQINDSCQKWKSNKSNQHFIYFFIILFGNIYHLSILLYLLHHIHDMYFIPSMIKELSVINDSIYRYMYIYTFFRKKK